METERANGEGLEFVLLSRESREISGGWLEGGGGELADYVTVLWREIFSTSFESSIETERYINFRRSISNVTGVAL